MFNSVNKQFFITAFSVMVLVMVSLSTSYAMFSDVQNGHVDNIIKSGALEIKFDDLENGIGNVINLEGAFPVSDEEGMATTPYTFRVSNFSDKDSVFRVMLLDDVDLIELEGDSIELLDHSNIKFNINDGEPMFLSDIAYNGYVLNETIIPSLGDGLYEVRVWIDEKAGNDALGKHYFGKLVVDGLDTPTSDSCFTIVDSSITGYVDKCVNHLVLPNEILNIGNNVFSNMGLESLVIPNTVVKIGNNAFSNNNVKIVDIPSSVEEIGDNAFLGVDILFVHGKSSLEEFSKLGVNWSGDARVEFIK